MIRFATFSASFSCTLVVSVNASPKMSDGPLYLGFDLSTQQLKGTWRALTYTPPNALACHRLQPLTASTAIVIQSDLQVISQAKVDFDDDFGSQYGLRKGVLVNEAEGEVFAPVAMWLEAVDLVLSRLAEKKTPLHRVRGISGACQQHGSVYWSHQAEALLGGLDGGKSLKAQLAEGKDTAFSHPFAPNWQDHSTQAQCDEFDAALGKNTNLADVTGSSAHHVSFLCSWEPKMCNTHSELELC